MRSLQGLSVVLVYYRILIALEYPAELVLDLDQVVVLIYALLSEELQHLLCAGPRPEVVVLLLAHDKQIHALSTLFGYLRAHRINMLTVHV